MEKKRVEVLELEKKAAQPQFWNNQEEAQKILKRRSRLEQDIQLDSKLARDAEDLKALAELANEDEDVTPELTDEVQKLEAGSSAHRDSHAPLRRARRLECNHDNSSGRRGC